MSDSSGAAVNVDYTLNEYGSALSVYSAKHIEETSPIVVVLGGSEGGIFYSFKLTSAILAHGHAMTSIAYHGALGTPAYVKEISIEPIIKRISDLRSDAEGNQRCVAVIGISKGAELALLLAAKADVADVTVAIVPSNVVWQSSEIALSRHSSWVYNGEPLPFVEYPWFSKATLTYLLQGAMQARGIHEAGLKSTTSLEEASIPVENISKPVLLQGSIQDNIWPSHEMSLAIMERVINKNPKHRFQLRSYDLNHFLVANQEPVDDALKFITQAFNANPTCEIISASTTVMH